MNEALITVVLLLLTLVVLLICVLVGCGAVLVVCEIHRAIKANDEGQT